MTAIEFKHLHSAHCETGVTAALLNYNGFPLSEPMAFGIASGLFFVHLPVKDLWGAPNTTFRTAPGRIFTKVCKRLGVDYQMRTYRDEQEGAGALDALVGSGVPVAVQTNVFWLSHMPRRFRFQFNAHNLVVYGRTEEGWKVSDPVLEVPLVCTVDSLQRARFAKGFLAPRGRLYFVTRPPTIPPARLRAAVHRGLISTAWSMVRIPLPIVGARAIGFLADRMENWPRRYKDPFDSLTQLSTVVRMLEEIGTGGAGFRYLYAAFLQQAAEVLDDARYLEFSTRLTAIGDTWRQFAAKSARICRQQKAELPAFGEAAALVRECGLRERGLFGDILDHDRKRSTRLPISVGNPALPP